MTLITKLAAEPTGTYAADLPTLVPGAGITGFNYRFAANTLTAAVGSTVSSWSGTGGSMTADTAKPPVLAEESGIKYLRFDGVDDRLIIDPITAQRTILAVVRVWAALGTNNAVMSMTGNDFEMVRKADNRIGVGVPGTGVIDHSGSDLSTWSLVQVTLDATQASVKVNGGTSTSATSTGAGITSYRLGVTTGTYGKIDVAEAILFPTVLTAQQLTDARASLKAKYPALP